jgi:glucosamine-6-phosphate deaminase
MSHEPSGKSSMSAVPCAERPLDVVVLPPHEAAEAIVDEIAELAGEPRASARPLVVGLATGKTPIPIYEAWVRRARSNADLRCFVGFNLDEYLGLGAEDPRSCARYLETHLGRPLGLDAGQIRVPDWRDPEAYERAIDHAGGIDLQILGIGRNGHIAFNEPGSARTSRTRTVDLAATTREDAAAGFGALERVPARGVTMGIATILAARRVRIFAFGTAKRGIVGALLRDGVHAALPASFVRTHADARLFVDADAIGQANVSVAGTP